MADRPAGRQPARGVSWLDDWGSRLALVLGGFVVVYLVWLATKWFGADNAVFISTLALAVPGPVAALLTWRNSTHPDLDPRSRRAWRIIGFAYLSFWVGDVFWFYYEAILKESPFPSPADFGYLAFYPLLLWGLLSFPLGTRTGSEGKKFWLDAGTTVIGGAMVAWHFVLYATFATQHEGILKAIIALAYPVMDLVLFLGIAMVLLRRPSAGSRNALSILVASLLIQVGYDLIFAYQNLNGTWQSASWPDAVWIGARFLAVVAGQYQFVHASQPRSDSDLRTESEADQSFSLLPYVGLTVGYGLLLVVGRSEWSSSLGGLILGALALTGLVAGRQLVALRENASLLAERATRDGQQRFQALVQHASDVIVVLDSDGIVRYQSPAIEKVLGYRPDYRLGEGFAALVHPEDAALMYRALAATREEAGSASPIEVRLQHRDGLWRTTEIVASNRLADPTVEGIVLTYRDITERKTLEDQLRRKAFHDSVTGLPNRSLFLDRLEQALARAARRGEAAGALVIDLDRIKGANKGIGQQGGERLLADVAARMQDCLRGGDTLAHLSADTFAIILEGLASQREATDVADRLLRAFDMPFRFEDRSVVVSASIGVALSTPEVSGANELLRYADAAMIRARQHGKARYECFDTTLSGAVALRQSLEADLQQALERDEFVLHYQPRVTLESGEIEGVEALLRWQHPERGLLPPAEFMPLVEQSDLIRPLGRWVLETACRQLHQWQVRYEDRAPRTVSINLSGKQFQRPGLIADMMRALRNSGLAPQRLQCEIAEQLVAADPVATLRILLQLKGVGVRVVIDEVGMIDASLAHLQQYPTDGVKIARALIAGLGTEPQRTAMVRAVQHAANERGLTVTAEGIETAAALAQLRALGCQLGQGYYFSQPLAAEQLEPLLLQGLPVGSDATLTVAAGQ
ncbi:MAG: EAL domain-containing protein [Chloroflexia bacterium]